MPDLKRSAPTDSHVPLSVDPLSPVDASSEDDTEGRANGLTDEQRAAAAEAAAEQVAAVLRRRRER